MPRESIRAIRNATRTFALTLLLPGELVDLWNFRSSRVPIVWILQLFNSSTENLTTNPVGNLFWDFWSNAIPGSVLMFTCFVCVSSFWPVFVGLLCVSRGRHHWSKNQFLSSKPVIELHPPPLFCIYGFYYSYCLFIFVSTCYSGEKRELLNYWTPRLITSLAVYYARSLRASLPSMRELMQILLYSRLKIETK